MAKADVAVVIPTKNRGALIAGTLQSLLKSTIVDLAIWIVDQSDDGATRDLVIAMARQDPRLHYLRSQTVGSSAARNEGIAASSGSYVLYTDDDCLVAPDWAEEMVAELSAPDCWAVFGQVVAAENDRPPDLSDAPWLSVAVTHKKGRQRFGHNRLNLGFGHGANMGFRRDALTMIAGFDPLLGVGGALRSWPERDIGYRIMRAGGGIVFAPAALVRHRQWRDWGEVIRAYRNYGFGAGAAAGKYLRSGDWGGLYLFTEWLLDQGIRQLLSGLLKWRDARKMKLGWLQLTQPWVGLIASWRYPIDHASNRYLYQPDTKPSSPSQQISARSEG